MAKHDDGEDDDDSQDSSNEYMPLENYIVSHGLGMEQEGGSSVVAQAGLRRLSLA